MAGGQGQILLLQALGLSPQVAAAATCYRDVDGAAVILLAALAARLECTVRVAVTDQGYSVGFDWMRPDLVAYPVRYGKTLGEALDYALEEERSWQRPR